MNDKQDARIGTWQRGCKFGERAGLRTVHMLHGRRAHVVGWNERQKGGKSQGRELAAEAVDRTAS